VHTFHGNVFSGYFGRLQTALVVILERLLGHLTDAVVAVSRQQRNELLTFGIGSRSRVHAIPLGLDLQPFVEQPREDQGFREELGFPKDAPLVGMVTRLVPIKGIDLFLEAAAEVSRVLPDVRFVIVGLGELRDELEALAQRLGLEDMVRFTGVRRDTPRIYGALDLLVLSSHNEGLPVAVIEAAAAGCYVVATRVGGVPELVTSERVGLIVPSNDVKALSATMVAALQSERQVPQAVRKQFAERYGIDRLTTDIDALYSGLLARKVGQRLPL
jgi:glycosyltransferase involved in cell wall biosynthesis